MPRTGEGGATVAHTEQLHDVFLFHGLGLRWLVAALLGLALLGGIGHWVLRHRRWRRRLQRRRQIRARLHGAPPGEIDLREPPLRPGPAPVPGLPPLRDRYLAR